LGHVPLLLSFCMPSELLPVVDAHTKFEVSSFSGSKDIGGVYRKLGVVRHLGFDPKWVLTISQLPWSRGRGVPSCEI